MLLEDPHFRPRDHTAHWQNLASHLAAHPEDFDIALENLDRWENLARVHPGPIHEWRARIHRARQSPQAMRDLLTYLVTPNHDAEPLKSCSPFVGIIIPSKA